MIDLTSGSSSEESCDESCGRSRDDRRCGLVFGGGGNAATTRGDSVRVRMRQARTAGMNMADGIECGINPAMSSSRRFCTSTECYNVCVLWVFDHSKVQEVGIGAENITGANRIRRLGSAKG